MTGRQYTIGIDSGTQSTKSVLLDVSSGRVVAEAAARYALIERPDGTREQEPSDWIAAVKSTVASVVRKGRAAPGQVVGIGVSGQQHGFVPLDKQGNVIRRAKLWNDGSTIRQCKYLIKKLGGLRATIKKIGNGIPPGFTASKIRWLKECEPRNYDRLSLILLPHNYINYWLTGVAAMEAGDASGTALFDVRRRAWSLPALRAVDGQRDLGACLPPLQHAHEIVGTVRNDVAAMLGLSGDCIVSTGGGDNMMAAIGTGNVRPGVVTASLGTSGTIFAHAVEPVIDEDAGEIAAFCSSTGGWLPLLCVMNCTVATELVKRAFGLDTEKLTALAAGIEPGSGGLLLLPYFSGERTPNVPSGTGVLAGLTSGTFTPAHFCRAAMEGAVLGMNYGLERLRAKGMKTREILLTGGGAKNPLWRQMCADVFNTSCRTLAYEESAALGGAIQAWWAFKCRKDGVHGIERWTGKYVRHGGGVHKPDPRRAAAYRSAFERQCLLGRLMRPLFQ